MNETDILQEALEQGGRTAAHGGTEVRSGRMCVQLPLQRYVSRLLREAQSAYQSWAQWEAINDRLEDRAISDGLAELGLTALGPLRMALARDAILRAFRLSDHLNGTIASIRSPSDNLRCSLTGVAALLDQPDLVATVTSIEWAIDLGHRPDLAAEAAQRSKERIARFRSLVVSDWSKPGLSKRDLVDLRARLKPLRDRVLAHAIGDIKFDEPTVDQIRRFITLTLELASDMAFVFIGSAVSAEHFIEHTSEEGTRFWAYALPAK